MLETANIESYGSYKTDSTKSADYSRISYVSRGVISSSLNMESPLSSSPVDQDQSKSSHPDASGSAQDQRKGRKHKRSERTDQ